MVRSILILSILGLAIVNGAPTVCTEDNTLGVMQTCYTAFLKSYGIDNPFPLAEFFSGFHKARTDMLEEQGIGAKPAMKDYGVSLTKCLASVENCIADSTYELPALGAQQGDGHKYNTDRLITAYQTSDRGYEIQMRHFYALRSCADTQAAVTDQCDADLAAKVTPTCKDYSDNMQCFKNAFNQCVQSTEGGEFQCNSVGAEYKIFMKDALADGTCVFDACDK